MDKIGFHILDGKIRDQAINNLPIRRPANSTILTHTVILFEVGDVPLNYPARLAKMLFSWLYGIEIRADPTKVNIKNRRKEKQNRTKNSKQMEIAYTLSIENYNPGPTNIENVIGH